MGKGSGTIIGVIALILSLGFGGYFLYDKIFLAPAATSPSIPATKQYFDVGPGVYIPSGETWLSDSILKIDFN